MLSKVYKLEINGTKEKIDFGPRTLGERGRDIMAIKYALGVIDNYSERIDSSESTLDDPNGWFDCVTGKPVSNLQAATYDSNLQSYVTRFQLDNQFYILCYLFTKFAIPKNTSRINAFKRAEAYSGPEQGRQDYQEASSVSTWAQ